MKDEVTFGIALLGAALGVLNFWRSASRDRVRLKVVPANFVMSTGASGLCVQVTNLGFIPITVSEIGFQLADDVVLVDVHSYGNDVSLPERLEPRTAITFLFSPGTVEDVRMITARHAYAKTACGRTFKGRSKALASRVENLRRTLAPPQIK